MGPSPPRPLGRRGRPGHPAAPISSARGPRRSAPLPLGPVFRPGSFLGLLGGRRRPRTRGSTFLLERPIPGLWKSINVEEACCLTVSRCPERVANMFKVFKSCLKRL
eukprot:5605882-Pyramimonas_sp.AAC.1